MDLQKIKNVPTKPGVYLWKDKWGDFLYVGKAKNLRSRMQQYFKGMQNSYKTVNLVNNIDSFEYVITKTDREALILERNLIEKYRPKYNIKLTDDKHYPYLCVTLNKQLEISLTYRVKAQNSPYKVYYGPFPNGYGARKIVNSLNRIFTYHQGLPIRSNDYKMWESRFLEVKKLLSSHRNLLIKNLKIKMLQTAEQHQYEIAQDLKETIEAFASFEVKDTVTLKTNDNIDVIGFVLKNNFLSIAMLFYRQGTLLAKIDKIIAISSDYNDAIRQFINQYYSINLHPQLIITNEKIETDNLKILIPQRGINKQMLNLAINNASDNIENKLANFIRKTEMTQSALNILKNILKLKKLEHIVIIDNSHTNNTFPVSVLLSYRHGIKSSHESRKYNLKQTNRQADVEYMKQALTKHFIDKNHEQPDLLIVDGGKAQITEAQKILPSFNIIGLSKNEKHHLAFLVTCDGQKVKINDQALFIFLSNMQIEVDRYAKIFHQNKRKTTLEGILQTIPGIGPSLEKKLINHFKNYVNIYNSSTKELEKVVSAKIALAIKQKMGER